MPVTGHTCDNNCVQHLAVLFCFGVCRALGAAAVVTGVAAQYLGLNPGAGAAEVRRALQQQLATPQVVVGGGSATPTNLLFTNLTSSQAGAEVAPVHPPNYNTGSSCGLSAGAVAGIASAAVASKHEANETAISICTRCEELRTPMPAAHALQAPVCMRCMGRSPRWPTANPTHPLQLPWAV